MPKIRKETREMKTLQRVALALLTVLSYMSANAAHARLTTGTVVTVNRSDLTSAEVLAGMRVLTDWLHNSVGRHWHLLPVPIVLILLKPQDMPPNCAAGCHQDRGGTAVAYVSGLDSEWLILASHELAEATVNPHYGQPDASVFQTSYGAVVGEIADPVAWQLMPWPNGAGGVAWLSDYVYPAFYNQGNHQGPYDALGATKAPLTPVVGMSITYTAPDGSTGVIVGR